MRSLIGRNLACLDDATPSLSALARVLSPELVRETLLEAGKRPQRVRKLTPEIVTWLVVAMGLFRGLSIENVLAQIATGLGAVLRWGPSELPVATSISHARDRLGWEAVRALFDRLATSLAKKHEQAAGWHGLPVYVLDGSCFLVPDSKANDAEFGRPGTARGGAKSAFPALRAVLAVGARTHLIRHATFDAYKVGELTLAARLLPQLEARSLLLMDRAYYAYAWLSQLATGGRYFVVRAKSGGRALKPKKVKRLGDGDTRGTLHVPPAQKRKHPELSDTLEVRILRYKVKGRNGKVHEVVLATNLLDPVTYPASEIVALYQDRWEAELSYRELKTHQIEKRVAFRSQTPDRVRQEVWGLLIAYNCVRGIMADAAALKGVQPRQMSFVDSLARIRVAIAMLPSRNPERVYEELLSVLVTCVLPKRRVGRSCPRAVKIKMSKWPRKRPGSKVVAPSQDRR